MSEGAVVCARYCYSPNKLGLCGPRQGLKKYLFGKRPDRKLFKILSQFEAVFPYLQLIASENRITDSFNLKVIEAYWLGNELLNNISRKDLIEFLDKTFSKYLPNPKDYSVWEKIPKNSKPNHLFHVLEVFSKTAGVRKLTPITFEVMDKCRISWGKVIKILNLKYTIETKPLVVEKGRLFLGRPRRKKISGHQKNVKIGDWVSFHWDYLCDVLTKEKIKKLEYYSSLFLQPSWIST